MAELKAYLCVQARKIENKTFSCYKQTLAVKNAPEATMTEVYLRSDTDAYIRKLKYKRCLDKAERCESEEKRLEAIAPLFDSNKECWEYGSDYWLKWRKRWLELAEQFKDR